MDGMIFIDSNIWCYYFDMSAGEHEIVSKRLEEALKREVLMNTVVVMEVAHYLIKNLGSEGERKMDVFLSYPIEIVILTNLWHGDRSNSSLGIPTQGLVEEMPRFSLQWN